MGFQAYKISGGRGVLKNAIATGPRIAVRGRPPSPKTFRIWVSCFDRGSSASLTGIFKKFLVQGFGEALASEPKQSQDGQQRDCFVVSLLAKGCPELLYF